MFTLANIGGLLGLCLGFSLLSVVEVIYFFTLRWCVLVCRRKKMKDQVIVSPDTTVGMDSLELSKSAVFDHIFRH